MQPWARLKFSERTTDRRAWKTVDGAGGRLGLRVQTTKAETSLTIETVTAILFRRTRKTNASSHSITAQSHGAAASRIQRHFSIRSIRSSSSSSSSDGGAGDNRARSS